MAEQAARLGFIKSEIIKAERERKKERENRGSHQRGRDREIGVDFSQIDRLYLLFLGQRVPLSPATPSPLLPHSARDRQEMRNGQTGYCVLVAWGLTVLSKLTHTHTPTHSRTQTHTLTHSIHSW